MSYPEVLYVRPAVRILGVEFGRLELRDLLISSLALTVIFASAFAGGLRFASFFGQFLLLLPAAFLGAVPGSFVALAMQKRVGARAGCTIEFRLDARWTALSLILAVIAGVAFAITGRLSRFGNLTRSGAGRMGAAGPLAYLAIAGFALMGAVALRSSQGDFLFTTLRVVTQVDAWLAVLSLIPFPYFAGGDIWRWSKAFWVILAVAGAALFFAAGRL